MIAIKLAIRNLLRNRWRTGLTLAGVGVAVGLMVWTLAFYEGWIAELVQGATSVETGQLQIQTVEYAEDGRIYQSFAAGPRLLDSLQSVPAVAAVTPRVVAHGIVGNERRSRVARVVGVDPDREGTVSPVVEAVQTGRWLSSEPPAFPAPREVVLGSDLARQLRVAPGDELVVFLEASDGSLGNDLLTVVGTVRTGNSGLDRMAAFLHIEDARTVTALEGRVNTVVMRTEDVETSREVAAAVAVGLERWVDADVRVGAPGEASSVAEGTLAVRPWQEIVPAMNQLITLMRRSYWMVYLVIYLVAALGILNTQRMSALERRREFGVMLAVGVRPRRMFRILQVETFTIGVLGTLLGAAFGAALAWHHAVSGFDMTLLTDQASFTYMGVAFDERIHFLVTGTTIVQPMLVMFAVSLLSGLWPAIAAARIEPAPTIAGRRT